MLWSDLKTLLQNMAPAALRGNFVQKNSGTPTELAYYARLAHNEIAAFPHKFGWLLREYTLTLTGATTYNLKALIPDLVRVHHLPASQVGGREVPYQGIRTYNLDPSGNVRATFMGYTLKLTGQITGTITIPYFSNYLVLDADGVTRKQDFVNDGDMSIVPDEHQNMLVEGVFRYIYRKENKKQYQIQVMLDTGRMVMIDPMTYYLRQAALTDRMIHEAVYDFRFAPR